jgi:hypothetical protein
MQRDRADVDFDGMSYLEACDELAELIQCNKGYFSGAAIQRFGELYYQDDETPKMALVLAKKYLCNEKENEKTK